MWPTSSFVQWLLKSQNSCDFRENYGGVMMWGGTGKDHLNCLYIGAGYQQSLCPVLNVTVRNLFFHTASRFCNRSLVSLLLRQQKNHIWNSGDKTAANHESIWQSIYLASCELPPPMQKWNWNLLTRMYLTDTSSGNVKLSKKKQKQTPTKKATKEIPQPPLYSKTQIRQCLK